MDSEQRTYVCESCGIEKTMTPEEAYQEGWDYPPFVGAWGVVSPRTCGNCSIDTTLWWRLSTRQGYVLTEKDHELLLRIAAESKLEEHHR